MYIEVITKTEWIAAFFSKFFILLTFFLRYIYSHLYIVLKFLKSLYTDNTFR